MNIFSKFSLTTDLPARPVEKALSFILELDAFAEHFTVGRVGPGLLDALLQNLLDGNADGELMFSRLQARMTDSLVPGYSMTHEEGNALILTIILSALHFAVNALQSATADDAYAFLLDARYVRGLADGVIYPGNDALVRADLARLGAKARNAETEAMKRRIWVWYAEHASTFRSVDAAAQAATRQEPIAYTTARRWIGEYKKNNLLQ